MHKEMMIECSRVTEVAALASYPWLGRGNKNAADGAAVEAMRALLNQTYISGEIVIGEGEIDNAPMLYIGEKVGLGGVAVDIAVDPIEGTRMTAMGQPNALAVLAMGEQGAFLRAPDMYMEKLCTGPKAKGAIDLNLPLTENIHRVAKQLKKPLTELTVMVLDKPRHNLVIELLRNLGVRVFAVPDGDIVSSILTCTPESHIDLLYGIGGAPEGVISAAAIQALGGDMQGRLLLRDQVKGQSDENSILAQSEADRCKQMGIHVNEVLPLEKIALNDNVIFSATGITKGDLLDGVYQQGSIAITETLLIRGASQTIHRIKTTHKINR